MPRLSLIHIFVLLVALYLLVTGIMGLSAQSQTLNTQDYRIDWKVVNRFRLFNDENLFQRHETAWRQFLIHVDRLPQSAGEKQQLIASGSVLGTEHVLNDRYISFSRELRQRFDWRGWAAQFANGLCWDQESQKHDRCGGLDNYINPKAHEIEVSLRPLKGSVIFGELNCEWRVGDAPVQTAPCDQPIRASLPYPAGADIAVNVVDESPIMVHAAVRDLLIAGLGDSFGSGEGNPDTPVAFNADKRYRNLYPQRETNTDAGSAQWIDSLCHRSLYSYQLRAALQLALENPQVAVTYLGYACSGASVDKGILGPQEYVASIAQTGNNSSETRTARYIRGGAKDSQIYRLLREICLEKPEKKGELWTCPDNKYRRNVDYILLSVGGNDIGFSSIVAWASLREGTQSSLARFFGATVQPEQFNANMRDVLPKAYARLSRALETAVPLRDAAGVYDPAHIILTAYPDILVDEKGAVCPAGKEGDREDDFPANQSMDYFSSWLATSSSRIDAVHNQLETLHNRMKDLAGDQGWSFASRVYEDKVFATHGFCARRDEYADDPAEMLMIPCWGSASRATQTCQNNWLGKARDWRPYNPQTQDYPYAMRQRWVRTFNDAYMTVNQKVISSNGVVDETLSARTFSEATGGMHPNAEGHAAMADAMLLDLRKSLAEDLAEQNAN